MSTVLDIKKVLEEMEIVDEMRIGNAVIKVANNDYRDKTPEDIEEILDRVAQIALADFNR